MFEQVWPYGMIDAISLSQLNCYPMCGIWPLIWLRLFFIFRYEIDIIDDPSAKNTHTYHQWKINWNWGGLGFHAVHLEAIWWGRGICLQVGICCCGMNHPLSHPHFMFLNIFIKITTINKSQQCSIHNVNSRGWMRELKYMKKCIYSSSFVRSF